MTYKSPVIVICLLWLTALSASGDEFTPLRVRNLSPVILVQNITTAEPARLLPAGRQSVFLDLDLANHANVNSNAREQIHLDGETLVVTLGWRRALGENLQLGVDLPWVSHRNGSLDRLISDWHDLLGLSDGDRNALPDNELAFRYDLDGVRLLDFDRPRGGIGDLRLHLAWQVLRRPSLAAALHASLKAPTGSAAKLTGNEGWGASLGVAFDRRFGLWRDTPGALWGGLAGSWQDGGDILPGLSLRWVAHGWLGAGWSPVRRLTLKVQLDSSSGYYDKNLSELGSSTRILTVGGTVALNERTWIDLAVSEGLAVNASPDVTFHLGLAHRY